MLSGRHRSVFFLGLVAFAFIVLAGIFQIRVNHLQHQDCQRAKSFVLFLNSDSQFRLIAAKQSDHAADIRERLLNHESDPIAQTLLEDDADRYRVAAIKSRAIAKYWRGLAVDLAVGCN